MCAVEPEPHLRALAVDAAERVSCPITVTGGRADALPVDDADADAVVLCLVLCAVPDPALSLAEMRRVLRPGGRLVFLEHTLARGAGLRVVQYVADATIWPRLYGGVPHRPRPAALDPRRRVPPAAPPLPALPAAAHRSREPPRTRRRHPPLAAGTTRTTGARHSGPVDGATTRSSVGR